MGQYCFAGWRLSSSVTLPGTGPVGRRALGRSARGRPTLHGGPVVLRPVKVTPCFTHFAQRLLAVESQSKGVQ